MAAETHHYVPRFVLRQFLSDEAKEQVAVYDKHKDNSFVTSIKNIMSERRFNEFEFDEFIVSFESVASKIEDSIIPTYKRIVDNRRLEGTPDEKADLAFLIAFQMLRVKAMRDLHVEIERGVREKVEALGHRMEQIQGWEPLTEDRLKLLHLGNIQETIGKFALVIAEKDILLAQPSQNSSFYIGDNPVVLSNRLDFGPYGNIGLAVKGIEIYLPLSSDLLLCAFCPSILSEQFQSNAVTRYKIRSELQRRAVAGQITFKQLTEQTAKIDGLCSHFDKMKDDFVNGRPIDSNPDNMKYYNSLQSQWARRYLIDKRGDFKLAKKYISEFPQFKFGRKIAFN